MELYEWLEVNLKRPEGLKGDILLATAEVGYYSLHSNTRGIVCSNKRPIGHRAREFARQAGFLKTTFGSDSEMDFSKVRTFINALGD